MHEAGRDARMRRVVRWCLVATGLVGCGVVRAQGAYTEPVEARLVAATAQVRAGEPLAVGVFFRIRRGWHVYWLNPGDSGLATSVRWTLPEGFAAGPLRWPLPERFTQQGGAVGFGYAEQLLLGSLVTPPDGAHAPVPIRANVGWLACEKYCLRGTKTLELTLGSETPPAAVDPALFHAWGARLPVDPGSPGAPATVRVRGAIPRGGGMGTVAVTVSWRVEPAGVEWFPPDDQALMVETAESRTRDRRTVLTFRARRLAGEGPGPPSLESVLVWTDGDGARRGLRMPIDLEGGPR
jgi:DsbC/DsbD-like thiol-disulfide interchange protein